MPSGATAGDLQLMAPTMEAWLIACPKELETYFGKHFKAEKLAMTANTNCEGLSKTAINSRLASATKTCEPKGAYEKGRDSFELLRGIDPKEVAARCPHWFRRLCAELTARGMK